MKNHLNNKKNKPDIPLERYDQVTIRNLISGNHDPSDRLPYSMLVNVLRGKDFAEDVLFYNEMKGDRTFVNMAEQFVLLHIKVIEALCKHYYAEPRPNPLEDQDN